MASKGLGCPRGKIAKLLGRLGVRVTAGGVVQAVNHLAPEREHLFTFLCLPGVQATNWRAEQAIRPAVVTRKNWGGNRTWAGADTRQVLASVLRTATRQAHDPVELLTCLLRAPTPIVADVAIPGH
jgi:hypothetical protein